MELKVDHTPEEALEQIKNKNYNKDRRLIMCEGNLNFQILLDNKDLVAEKVLECIDKNFSIEEQEKT